MRHIFKIIFIVLISVKDLFALFGAGDIVSDPTSYTYYAKQIKTMNDEIKTALDQLEQLNKANEALNKANDLIFKSGEKIYNPSKQIKNLLNSVQGIQRRFKSTAERAKNMGVERFFKNYHNVDEPLNTEAYQKWKDNLSALFNNKEDEKYQKLRKAIIEAQEKKDYSKYQTAVNNMTEYLKLKKIEREAIKNASLKAPIDLYQEYFANADVVKEREERDSMIKDLASQVESEEDLMKQQQTTNQILLLVLETVQNQYEMQMKFFYALSLDQYSDKFTSIDYDLKEIKKDREKFSNAKNIDKEESLKQTQDFLDDLSKKGKKSSIYKILNGDENFYEEN